MATTIKYKAWHNYKPVTGQINEEPSQTVVGETWTIKELVERYQRGMDVPSVEPNYVDVQDIDQINAVFRKHLDLTDLDNLRVQVATLTKTVEEAQAQQTEIVETITPTVDSKEEVAG
jgi:hypothetical protein